MTMATCCNRSLSATAAASAIPSPLLTDADRAKQAQILLTLTENDYTNAMREPDAYRTPLPAESRAYELLRSGRMRRRPTSRPVSLRRTAAKVRAAGDGSTIFPTKTSIRPVCSPATRTAGDRAGPAACTGRTISALRRRSEALLPLGKVESLALPGNAYKLAFTPGPRRPGLSPRRAAARCPHPPIAGQRRPGRRRLRRSRRRRQLVDSVRTGLLLCDPDATPQRELADARRHFYLPRRSTIRSATPHVDYDPHNLLVVGPRTPWATRPPRPTIIACCSRAC